MIASRSDLRKFAEQVVEIYASRVALSLLAQGELERAVIARLAAADESAGGDRARLANEVIAEWESRGGARGPRVALTSSGRVVEKRAHG